MLFVVAIIALVAAIAIPNLIQSRKYSNETSAIEALKTVTSGELLFRERDMDNNGVNDYATLGQLSTYQLVDVVLGSGTKHGYVFRAGASTLSSEVCWFATANPLLPFQTGDRYFETSYTGVVYYTTTQSLTLNTTSCAADPFVVPVGK